ncbi:hypothetical protein H4R23_002804 [Coemansia sp. Cherry 401B]|nr:hypothetical protein IWW54_003233 [Coemansia sp. RSA 2705]KAJ2732609.1 hypothetical protein H4R23_002804 [Coemansia sp. Cherry 401B]
MAGESGQSPAAEKGALSVETDPDFLLSLRFGCSVDEAAQRRIIHYVKRVLYPAAQPLDTSRGPRRKRRRRDDAYASDRFSDSDPDDVFRANEGPIPAADSNGHAPAVVQSITFFSNTAGFDLDCTQVDDSVMVSFAHGTTAIVGLTNDLAQQLGNPCFNCSMPGHELRDCPMPQDEERIDANRTVFRERGSGQFSGRFYLTVEDEKRMLELRQKYRPGQPLSQALCDALDLEGDNDVPEYVESMYYHGYPPAYLGSDSNQDPMNARKLPTPDIPQTPDLQIYAVAEDYGHTHNADIDKAPTPKPSSSGEDANESDEEGAISESDANADDTVPGQTASSPPPVRNVPLVNYPGLDLREFDFGSTSRPGRPLRTHTPQPRRVRTDYRRHAHTDGHYDRFYSEGHRGRRRHHDDYYESRSPAPHRNKPVNGGSWYDMLEGYYRSARHDYTPADERGEYADHRDYYSRGPHRSGAERRYDANEYYDEPPQPPSTHAQQTSDGRNGSINRPSPTPPAPNAAGDGEVEDGECDMALSD